MPTMNAIVKTGATVALAQVPIPAVGEDQVRIRVSMVGVCRTDVQVARGQIVSADPLILGHECAGIVDAVGPAVRGFAKGTHVAVRPVFGCLKCEICIGGDEINCPWRTMLGLEHAGAFAEYVCVPARCVVDIPTRTPWQVAAYAEPVAAALAMYEPSLARGHILIVGRNRFALLVERLLRILGADKITIYDLQKGDIAPPPDSFDVVIETGLTSNTLSAMIRAARPRATLILKSRQPIPVAVDLRSAILKQLTFRAVNYGLFSQAVALLVENVIDPSAMCGSVYPLEAFAEVFALAEQDEAAKLFFDPTGEHVRDRR
jgi:threonine dehydrogenase-like Zn-dependent dehydrogenase